jgi:hypothetical protein
MGSGEVQIRLSGKAKAMELFGLGQRALGVSDSEVGRLLGYSRKTIWRWYAGRATMADGVLAELAQHVHARDPALAKRLWSHAAKARADARLPPPRSLPEPMASEPNAMPAHARAAPLLADAKMRVESVVHAACTAMNAGPSAAAPVVLAVLRRAGELAVTLADAERELLPAKPASRKSP